MGFGKCYRFVPNVEQQPFAFTVSEGMAHCRDLGFDGLVVFTLPKIHEPQEQQQQQQPPGEGEGGGDAELEFVRYGGVIPAGEEGANFWTGFYRQSGHWLYRDHRQNVTVGT